MLDTWRNRLCGRGVQCDIAGWIARHHKLQPSVANPNQPPGTVRHTVGTEQARGDGQLIPFRAGSGQTEALRKLGTIAERAIERRSDLRRSTLDMDDPRSELERRPVPYVLVVPARQLGDPVAPLVEVEPRGRSFHRSRVVAQAAGSATESAPTDRLRSQPSLHIVLAYARRSPRGGSARWTQTCTRAPGDPTRHRLFGPIADAARPVGVAELTDFAHLNHNAVRQHFGVRRAMGLVVDEVEIRDPVVSENPIQPMIRDLVFLSPLHPTLGATERRNLGTDVLAPISFLPWWDDAAQCQAFDLIRGLIEILVPFTSHAFIA